MEERALRRTRFAFRADRRYCKRVKPSGRLRDGSRALALFAALGLGGCAAQRTLPPAPVLPEVRFVPPCDPDAAIALTAEDEQALVARDRMMRARINQLESIIREDQ